MNTEKKSLSNAEKMKRWREEKIKKKKEADKKHYELNRERKIAKVKENRDYQTGRLNKVNKVTTRATRKIQEEKNQNPLQKSKDKRKPLQQRKERRK